MYGIYNFPGSIDVANIGGGITVSEITVGNVAYSARESHSPCATGLNETMEESSVSIFPNPATNQVEIRNPKFEMRNIEFYNLLGEKLFSNSVTSNQEHVTVNVSKLSPGIYFVKVKGEKVESVGKFVKQ